MATRGMTGERWRELRNVGPRFRWATDAYGKPLGPMPAGRASIRKGSGAKVRQKHSFQTNARTTGTSITGTRGVPSWHQRRRPGDEGVIVHMTKAWPWKVRQANRERNKRARRARRANR